MSLRNKKVFLYCGAAFLVFILAEVIWLGFSAYRYSVIKAELTRNERRQNRLERRDPYPSPENEKALAVSLDELDYRVGELKAELNRDPIPRTRMEPTELSAHIQTRVERFIKDAERAGVALPDKLEGGFSQYASGGAVASPGDVPRLMRQLYSVGAVADVLINAGVASIEDISRDEFETANIAPVSRRRRPGRPSGADIRDDARVASEIGPRGIYLVEQVKVSFSAQEEVVWRVLSSMASAPRFMVVKEFAHLTPSGIMDYSPRAVTQGLDPDDETLAFLREGVLRGDKALSRPERIITGNEVVQVRMVVDVYNFDPEVSHGSGRR